MVGVGQVVGPAPDPDPRRLRADREPEHAEVAGRQVVDRDQRLHQPVVRGGGQRGQHLVVGVEQQQVAARLDAAGEAGSAGARGRRGRRRRPARRSRRRRGGRAAAGRRRARTTSHRVMPSGASGVRAGGRVRGAASRTAALPASTSYVDPVSPARSQGCSPSSVHLPSESASRTDTGPSRSSHRWTPSSTAAYVAAAAPSRRPRSLIRGATRPRRRRPARRSSPAP